MEELRRKRKHEEKENKKNDVTNKKGNVFNANEFRKNLKQENGWIGIKNLLSLTQRPDINQDVILEYLEAGGSVQELLSMMDTSSKEDLTTALPIFNLIRLVLMKIQSSAIRYQQQAEEGVRFLLHSFLPTINAMLAMNSSKHRKSVLKLLTSIVTLDQSVGREVLNLIAFQPTTLEQITQASSSPESVRHCFIFYLLSYLVVDDPVLLKLILDKKGFLNSIIPNLIYDPATTVTMVLSTLMDKILINPAVSKTTKLNIFNTKILKSLIELYDWKGPRNVKSTLLTKQAKRQKEFEPSQDDIDLVVDSVNNLLSVLLCSKKQGVVFQDKTLGSTKKCYNELLLTALEGIPRPWERKETSELVVNILVACPDLVKLCLSKYETSLQPRYSQLWIKALNFTESLISSLDCISVLKPFIKDLSTNQISHVCRNLCTPLVVVRNLANGVQESDSMLVCYHSMRVLNIMLDKLCNTVNSIASWGVLNHSDLTQCKNSMLDFVSSNFPTSEQLTKILINIFDLGKKADSNLLEELEESGEVPPLTISLYIHTLLDLLLSLGRYNTNLVSDCSVSLEELLEGVERLKNILHKEDLFLIKRKVIELTILVDSSMLTPASPLFTQSIKVLFYGTSRSSSRTTSVSSLVKILTNTNLFQNNSREMYIWIYTLISLDKSKYKYVPEYLAECIADCYRNPLVFQSNSDDPEPNSLSAFLNGLVRTSDSKAKELSKPDDTLSPLLMHALKIAYQLLQVEKDGDIKSAEDNYEKKSQKNISFYLKKLVVNLLHTQTDLNQFHSLLNLYSSIIPKIIFTYITKWKTGKCAKFGSKTDISNNLCGWLWTKIPTNTTIEDILPNPDIYELFLNFNMTTFFINHIMEYKHIPRKKSEKLLASLVFIIKYGCEEGHEEFVNSCLDNFFKNPQILKHFNVFTKHDRAKHFIILILKLIQCLKFGVVESKYTQVKSIKISFDSDLVIPFKDKFLKQLLEEIGNEELNMVNFNGIIQVLGLDLDNIKLILSCLRNIQDMSIFITSSNNKVKLSPTTKLLSEILTVCRSLQSSCSSLMIDQADIRFLSKVWAYLLSHETLDRTVFEEALSSYVSFVPYLIYKFDPDILTALLHSKKINESSIQLGQMFLNIKNNRDIFINHCLQEKLENPVILFPLAWKVYQYGDDRKKTLQLLKNIFDNYKKQIIKSLINSKKEESFVLDNVEFCKKMLELFISSEEVIEIEHKMKHFHLDLAFTLIKQIEPSYHKTVRSFVTRCLNIICQRILESLEVDEYCDVVCGVVEYFKDQSMSWSKIANKDVWNTFVALSLKHGLRSPGNSQLLKALADLSHVVYIEQMSDNVEKLFEMATSHSDFLNIILGYSPAKYELVRLFYALVVKNINVMSEKHVPVLLAAYHASLSSADQIILKILQLYESNGMKLTKYEPFLWGETAGSHYSVRTSTSMSLWRQANMKNVLDIIDMKKMKNSIAEFPINRKIQASSESLPNLTEIYDPAFLLPLFSNILNPGNVAYCHTFVYSGCLSYTLMSLSSCYQEIRSVAALVLSRFYNHVQLLQRNKQKQIWLHLLDCVRFGVKDILSSPLPSIVCAFLAQITLDISQPIQETHGPLLNYIVAKYCFDLNTLPEFLPLFHDSSVAFRKHRLWILQVLKTGIKQDLDLTIIFKSMVLKFLMSFYSCTLSDTETKYLILEVLTKLLSTKKSMLLVTEYSLLPWLKTTVSSLKPAESSLVPVMISLHQALTNLILSENKLYIIQTWYITQDLLNKLFNNLKVDDFNNFIKTISKLLKCLQSLDAQHCLLSLSFVNLFKEKVSSFYPTECCFVGSCNELIEEDSILAEVNHILSTIQSLSA